MNQSMKIVKIIHITSYLVETDEKEFNEYTRYDSDCWFVRIGKSDEPVCNCEKLEKLFQESKT